MSSKHTGKNDVTQKLFVEAGTGIGREKDGQRRCLGCMELYSEEYEVCPYCGYTIAEEVENALHMFPGTVLYDKYIIGRVIGYGGFGVTYLAWDTVLQIKVAIKEYLPSEFSTRAAGQTQITVFSGDKTKQFNDGMEKFVDEAKRLAKFRSENGIVKIFDSFNENGTAYIAMEYLQGETLAERLERDKTIPVEESIQMLMPIIESLNRVHDEGIIHRDIAPDNIFLTNKGEVKLIDFGASRYATTSRSRSLTVIIKPGFSAEEQYRSRGDQGSHTDVYSVGACLYKMITGQAPPDAMERRALFEKNGKDMLVPIKKFIKDIDPRRENAIYNALNIRIEDRTPDMISLAGELLSEEPVKKRRSGIKKIDPLTWPLWAKIGIPTGLVAAITLCVLFAFGIIGPKSELETRFVVPEGQTLIPNVVAGTLEDAKSKLKDENLNWQIAGKVISTVIDRDLVLRQDPDAFNVVDQGTIIDIIISDGHGMGTVPDVVGLTIELATEKLKEAGYQVKTVEESSDIYASGAVIAQEYEPGTMLEKENEIQLTVSTGPEGIDRTKVVKVPSILGMDYDEAKKLLADFKLFPAIDEEVYNSSIPDNQIMGQNPLANTEAHQGDTIYVTVNRGTQTVYVPDVVNKTLEMALSELENAGLSVSTKEAQNAEYAPGVVFQQSIKPGTSVTVGTQITVTVSSGFKVKVPDLTGKRSSDAQKTLVNAGLAASITTEPSDSVSKDRVITHDYIGEEVERGTTITLVVSSGRERTNSSGNGGGGYTDEEKEEEAAALVSLSVSSRPKKTEYYVGDSLDTSGLKVEAKYSDDTKKDVTSSCHVLDADLSSAGTVSVKVTFEDNGIEKTTSFTVNVNKPSVKVESSFNVAIGQTITLSAKVKPEDAKVTWSIDDNKIAEVSGDKLKGVKAGRTRVTATISYSGEDYTSSATVNVSDGEIPVEKLVLDKTSLKLRVDGKYTLKVTPVPANATTTNYKWTSNNTSAVGVSSKGEVQGVGPGKAKVTVTSSNGKTAACDVTVEEVAVTSISIVSKPTHLEYYPTQEIDLTGLNLKVNYSDGTSSTMSDISQVTYKHAQFNKKGPYAVTITYKGQTATFNVEVRDAIIRLSYPVRTLTTKGTVSPELTVVPSNIKVKFTSSNESIVSVAETTGVVKGLKPGKATVKVTGILGNVSLTAEYDFTVIDVEPKSFKISSKPSKMTYYVGDTIDTTGLKVDVTYSDGSVDKGDSSGHISAKFGSRSGQSEVLKAEYISRGKALVYVSYSGLSQTQIFEVTAKTPTIKIDKSSLELEAGGDEKKINASNVDCEGAYSVSWESSETSVATVKSTSSNGRNAEVSGASEGTAQVRAILTYKGEKYYSDWCNVTVKGATIDIIDITSGPSKTIYYVGDSLDTSGLKVKVRYSNGKTETISSGYGVNVTTLKSSGSQTVTVSYGGKTDTFSVTVKKPTISFSLPGTLTTSKGETLTADVTSDPSSGWELKFTSSDESKATVGEKSGIITGHKAGDVTITLVAKYKGIEETKTEIKRTLTIVDVQPVSFEISSNPSKMTYFFGESLDIDGMKVKVKYSDGTSDSLDSSGLIKAYVSKDKSSKVITPDVVNSRTGKAVVYVYYGDLTDYDKFEVTVKTPTVKLNKTSMTLDYGEENDDLSVSSVSDAGSGYTLSWETKDSSIVSVSGENKATIKAEGAGSTQVRAVLTYEGGKKYYSDWCNVTVKEEETTTTTTTQEDTETSEQAVAVDEES